MGLGKRLKSFIYAGRGIRLAFASEANMKIHIVVMLAVIVFGFILKISMTEWMICFLCFGLVIGAEIFNTAIEHLVDMISPEQHPVAGKIKDLASGAVLICAISSAIAGLLIFIPKAWNLFLVLVG